MARSTRQLIWRAPDLSRFGYGEVHRLRLPDGCRLDVLDLDDEDRFAALRVTWPAESIARVAVERSIEDWWRGMGRATARPPAPVVSLRPAAHHPAKPLVEVTRDRRPNFRTLLARALHELERDFEAAIARKLEQLMGDPPSPTSRRRASTVGPPPSSVADRHAPAMRSRDARDAGIRARILAALADGRPRGRSEILSAAHLFEDQVRIVIQELRVLRGQRLIEMRGPPTATKYVIAAPTAARVPPVVRGGPAGGTSTGGGDE